MTTLRATLAALVVAALQGCEAPGAGSGRLPGAAAGADRCDDPEALAAWRDARGAVERGDAGVHAADPIPRLAEY